jgi:hypothetical protein
MTSPNHLSYLAAREHMADLTRSAEQARLARAVRDKRDDSRPGGPIARIVRRLPRRSAQPTNGAPAVAPRPTTGVPAVAPPGCLEP